MNKSIIKILLFGALFVLMVMPLYAQDTEAQSKPMYFITGDENDVPQVFQFLLGSDDAPRQLTYSETGVVRYGVAYDSLKIVYAGDGQLWLQSIHSEGAEALAPIDTTNLWTNPIFSQDGNYIAYVDNGVWLYDLANRQTSQILEDVPLAENASNANEYRIFQPQTFVVNADGTVNHLIVDIGQWEWNSAGVYEIATNELTELDGQLHTDILALSDGRTLVFGNSPVSGEGSLHIAASLDDINNTELLVLFHELTEATMFAEKAVEIKGGIVRVFGSAIALSANPDIPLHFYFDFDLETRTIIGEVQLLTLTENLDQYADILQLSSDASLIPVYYNTRFGDAGIVYGHVHLLNIVTQDIINLAIPESVSVFQFQS